MPYSMIINLEKSELRMFQNSFCYLSKISIPGIDCSNIGFSSIIFRSGKVVKISDFLLSRIILCLCEVVEVSDFTLAGIVLALGALIKGSNFGLTGRIFRVQFAFKLGDISYSRKIKIKTKVIIQ